jgi:hypothetical protein
MRVLELDLDVYQGPFDLLLSLVFKEEIDLLEVPLRGYLRLPGRGEAKADRRLGRDERVLASDEPSGGDQIDCCCPVRKRGSRPS